MDNNGSPAASTPNDANANNGVNAGQTSNVSYNFPTPGTAAPGSYTIMIPNGYPTVTTSTSTAPTTPAPTTPTTPAPSTPAQTPVDMGSIAQQIAQYELRVRDLQSQKDRMAEEASKATRELEALKTKHTEIVSGAADAARQALEKANQLEQQLQQERARSLKAEALAQHPELAPYADLIPATTNQEELTQRIAALTAARERDQQAQQQASNTTAQQPNQRTIIPPANPARPNPSNQQGPSTQQMETDLRAAMEQALAKNDWSIYQNALDASIRAAGLQRNG